MPVHKNNHIITHLQNEILSLQGFKVNALDTVDVGLGKINKSFPNGVFPTSTIHEFLCTGKKDTAATSGFIAGITSRLMANDGVSAWICTKRLIFPPALKAFGIAPEKIVFIEAPQEKQLLWVTEEALKCEGLSAVIAEIPRLDFTTSRRLQLAVEKSLVTGFVIRTAHKSQHNTACTTRWQIKAMKSETEDSLPGIGYPKWNVSLIKVKNGKPGNWEIEWRSGSFYHKPGNIHSLEQDVQKKTG